MKRTLALIALGVFCFGFADRGFGQSLGNAGTIEGAVFDPSGAAVQHAMVTAHNELTGYRQSVATGADGAFRLVNIPQNPYHLEVTASGFSTHVEDVAIRGSVPLERKITLKVAGAKETVTVEPTADTWWRLIPRRTWMWTGR